MRGKVQASGRRETPARGGGRGRGEGARMRRPIQTKAKGNVKKKVKDYPTYGD